LKGKRTIGVLAGGDSPERDISLISGSHVHRALVENGHDASLISIDSLDDLVPRLGGIDVVFNCLHGGPGEDGTVQLLLDVMGIPYAGSGARACFRAMEKPRSLAIFATQGIPIPEGLSFESGDLASFLEKAIDALGFPMVIKPGNAGSTVSVHYIEDEDRLRESAASVLETFPSLVVEKYIEGREITVGVLRRNGSDQALPVIEIRIPGKLFDYAAKYTDGVAEFLTPAPLEPETAERLQAESLRAHEVLGCAGFSRVDLRLAEDGSPYVLEVNTLPGMTPISDLPRAAAAAGIPFERLVDVMLSTADKEENE
jgi:D-alanine-D-alanine ligase